MKIRDVEAYLEEVIEEGLLPGAVLRVSHNGSIVLEKTAGWRELYPSKNEMTSDTVFDLASLTKVVATLPIVLKLLDEDVISLADSIQTYLPDLADQEVTIQHLLTHTSGLEPTKEYFKQGMTYEQAVQDIAGNSQSAKAGEKVLYSDLGFILLKEIVEVASGTDFQALVEREIFSPLRMKETGFTPTFPEERYAATEYSDLIGAYKRGRVHDENAYHFGGVSGHAGLFSTMDDLSKYASMIEQNGRSGGRQILKEETVQLSRKWFTDGLAERRGLGWQLKDKAYAPCGELFSNLSYGHTGFTGTSMWFDPERSLSVILLTNRVHLGRRPDILTIRPKIHSLIAGNIGR